MASSEVLGVRRRGQLHRTTRTRPEPCPALRVHPLRPAGGPHRPRRRASRVHPRHRTPARPGHQPTGADSGATPTARPGHLISETDFDGRTLTYTHDGAGRLLAARTLSARSIAFERDVLGQVTRKNADDQVTAFAYDLTDSVAWPPRRRRQSRFLARPRGRLVSETVNGRATDLHIRRDWAAATAHHPHRGRQHLELRRGGPPRRAGHLGPHHRLHLRRGRPRTDPPHRRDATLAHAFDAAGPPHRPVGDGVPGRPTVQQRGYTYRADGHLAGVDDQLNGTRHFDLDAAGRVTAVHAANWTERYAYDEAGNQTDASWPARHPGHEATGARAYTGTRITRAGNVRYEHDDAGPHHPAPEDPPVPQAGHLALRVGRRRPPHLGRPHRTAPAGATPTTRWAAARPSCASPPTAKPSSSGPTSPGTAPPSANRPPP